MKLFSKILQLSSDECLVNASFGEWSLFRIMKTFHWEVFVAEVHLESGIWLSNWRWKEKFTQIYKILLKVAKPLKPYKSFEFLVKNSPLRYTSAVPKKYLHKICNSKWVTFIWSCRSNFIFRTPSIIKFPTLFLISSSSPFRTLPKNWIKLLKPLFMLVLFLLVIRTATLAARGAIATTANFFPFNQ